MIQRQPCEQTSKPDFAMAAEGLFEYGSRVGFWRLMRLFQERGLPMTIFGCGLAMERNPEASAAIAKSGFDVCSHGWRWIKHYELDEATEREHIRKAIAAIQKMTGERPLGWYCRYGPGVNTRRLGLLPVAYQDHRVVHRRHNTRCYSFRPLPG